MEERNAIAMEMDSEDGKSKLEGALRKQSRYSLEKRLTHAIIETEERLRSLKEAKELLRSNDDINEFLAIMSRTNF